MEKRNEKGQFEKTTDGKNTKYKAVQYMGSRMDEHCRNMCIVLGIDKIPSGFVVHHLDGNKKNNDIDNLALVTTMGHGKMHTGREPWNKGLTTETSEKWNETIQKAIKSRKGHYVAKKGKEVYQLKKKGMSFRAIARELGIARETASKRMQAYLNYHKLIDPTTKKRTEKYQKVKELRYGEGLTWNEVGEKMGADGSSLRVFYKKFLNIQQKNV